MTTNAIDRGPREEEKTPLAGFWARVKSLRKEAQAVQQLPAKALRRFVKTGAPAPAQRAALVKHLTELERSIHEIRQQLEKALRSAARTAKASTDFTPQALIAKGELIQSAALVGRLGWTRQALSKALGASRVFYIEHAGTRYYPAFYVDSTRYERRHLEAVSKMLGDLPGGAKLLFFLTPKGSLARSTPLEALAKGKVVEVLAAAEGFAKG